MGSLLVGPAQAELPGVTRLDGPWWVLSSPARGETTVSRPVWDESGPTVRLPVPWSDLAGEESDEVWLGRHVIWTSPSPTPGEPLGLLIPAGGWGHLEVWIAGRREASLGEQGELSGLAVSKVLELPAAVGFYEGETLELRLTRPAGLPRSWLERHGPLGAPPVLGDRARLEARCERERLARLDGAWGKIFLAVFLVALGGLHLHLFLRRRRSPEYFWFALAAIDFALASSSDGWLAEVGGDLVLGLRLRDASAHLLVALLIQLLWTVLGRPVSRLLGFYQASHVLLALLVSVANTRILLWSSAWRWSWGLLGWGVMLVLLVWSGRRVGSEGRIFWSGAALVVLCGTYEWLAYLAGWGEPFMLSVWAFLVFAVAMAVSLGGSFHRASNELEVLHHQLGRMVEDRAAELSAANERLRSEIAERQLAEEAMRMLERAVEQSIDGILVTDLDGRAQFANEAWARMHGHEPFDALGRGLDAFHSGRQLVEEVEPSLEEVRRQGAFAGEIFHCGVDGRDFPCWTTITLLRDGEGADIGFVFVGRDVSERYAVELEQSRLELKVRQAKKLESLGNLAGGIAHDYNNLLTGVLGNAMLLQRSLDPGSQIREKVRQIEMAAERAAELTSQLLAYAGEDPLLIERCHPAALFAELEPGLRSLISQGVVLELVMAKGLPEVGLDPRQVGWALRNLVRNGVEALGGQGGQLTITVDQQQVDRRVFAASYLDEGQHEGLYLEIEVRDTGCGIDPELRHRVFDPFFSTRASARGLGLATVLGVVRAHRGAVVIESEAGEGTAIRLLFPIEPVAPPPRRPRSGRVREEPTWRGSGKILVVDDEALMREVSASILEEQGFEVLTASEGHEAVAIYRREQGAIRLVLLDRTMPRMSGDRVLREIRSMDESAVVVMMSGFKQREALAGLDEEPPSGFIQKPFRPDELVCHLRQWLERSDSRGGEAGDGV